MSETGFCRAQDGAPTPCISGPVVAFARVAETARKIAGRWEACFSYRVGKCYSRLLFIGSGCVMRFAAALALLLCVSGPAFAQVGVGPGAGGAGMGGGYSPGGGYGSGGGFTPAGVPSRGNPNGDDDQHASKEDKPQEPPPAIPGAQPDADAAVAPADKLAAEMSPNDALFDAISRGDLAAAKDALNRGAQLDAHNVLGQTPIDSSIDLDRNDITFLLLSMRQPVSPGQPAAGASAAPPARGKGRMGAVVEASAHDRGVQLSANRGQPNPAVGFIGF